MMACRERWKPVFFALIFALGFFIFSNSPFTTSIDEIKGNFEEPLNPEVPLRSKRALDYSLEDSTELEAESRDLVRRYISNKKHIKEDDSIEMPKKQFKKKHHTRKHKASGKTAHSKKKLFNNFDTQTQKYSSESSDSDNEEKQFRPKAFLQNYESKRKTDTESPKNSESREIPSNISYTLNPKPLIHLPIVDTEMVKEAESNISKLIFTKQRPFHFHIPIASKNPENKPSLSEFVKTAKNYKNPLNYDTEAIKATVIEKPLDEKQRSTMRRMVRDSPVLDFLNIAAVIGKQMKEDEENLKSSPNDTLYKGEKVDSESVNPDLIGNKRSVVNLTPTDEVLQELVGDYDDLLGLQDKVKSRGVDEEEIDAFTDTLYFNPGEAERTKRHIAEEYNLPDNSQIHSRPKRGLIKWFKKNILGRTDPTTTTSSKTTTTTTTIKPKKKSKKKQKSSSSSSSSSSESSEKPKIKHSKKKEKAKKKEPKYFVLSTDSNGDTEADKLLPVYLRRSSKLEREGKHLNSSKTIDSKKHKNKKAKASSSSSSSSSEEEDKKKRNTRSINEKSYYSNSNNYNSYNPFSLTRAISPSNFPFSTLNKFDVNPQNVQTWPNRFMIPSSSFKRSKSHTSPTVTQDIMIITELSKDEIKLLHEMLSNMIKARCTLVDSMSLEKLQTTVNFFIDQSSWQEYSTTNRPSVDKLLQQFVSCSSNAELSLKWRAQRNPGKKSSKYEEYEPGNPLLRSKRVGQNSQIFIPIMNKRDIILHNSNKLISIMSKMTDIVQEACDSIIDTKLIKSMEALVTATIRYVSNNLDPTKTSNIKSMLINSKDSDKLTNSLNNCDKNSQPAAITNNLEFQYQAKQNQEQIPVWMRYQNLDQKFLPIPLPVSAPPTPTLQNVYNFPIKFSNPFLKPSIPYPNIPSKINYINYPQNQNPLYDNNFDDSNNFLRP